MKRKNPPGFDADFDTFWKEALNLVKLATSFYLPNLYQDVNWDIPYKPLEQELRSLFRGRKGRLRRTDKLFRLHLKDGTDRVVFFHIEAEAYPDSNFPKRMLEYYMLLSLKFGFIPITLLAIFVGEKPKNRLNSIKIANYGTQCELRYNTYSVADQSENDLLSDQNPFALLVLANLYVIQSKQNPELRMLQKRKLVQHLHQRKISFDLFHQLLNFATFLIQLPEPLATDFEEFYNKTYKNKEDMTGKQKFIAHEKKMAGILLKNLYGKTFEEVEKEYLEVQNQAAEAKNQAAEAKNQAEEAQSKAAEAKNQALEIQRSAAEMQRKSVFNLYEKLGLSPDQIASTLEIDLSLVHHILEAK